MKYNSYQNELWHAKKKKKKYDESKPLGDFYCKAQIYNIGLVRFSYCDIYSLSHSYPPELQLSAEAISSVYTNGFNCVKQTLPEYRNGISV